PIGGLISGPIGGPIGGPINIGYTEWDIS
ncbi:MAG: hypothetical protein RL751_1860, partial [Bacteroidota bacterium]